MAIDTFTKAEFEKALPVRTDNGQPTWTSLGLFEGEFSYLVPVTAGAAIMIRSSIGESGVSAGTGKNSIRLWLVDPITYKPVGSKLNAFTNRTPGWQTRVTEQMRSLWRLAKLVKPCSCGGTVGIYRVKKTTSPLKGRIFVGCSNFGCRATKTQWTTIDSDGTLSLSFSAYMPVLGAGR